GGKFAFILHKTPREFVHVSAAFHVAIPNGGALSGGLPGASVVYLILRDSNVREEMGRGRIPEQLDAKTGTLDVLQPKSRTTQDQDDVYAITFFGGGGYGDPLDREPERVAADLKQGLVSAGEAMRLYGVMTIDGVVDEAATDRRRSAMRAERLGRPFHGPL